MSRERLTWGFDCDDVVVLTAAKLIDALNALLGTDYGPDELYNNSEKSWFERAIAGLAMYKLLREGVLDGIEPDPAAVEALHYLASLGDELHLVTGRQEFLKGTTSAMVDRHFRGVFTSITHTNHFSRQLLGPLGPKPRTKGSVCHSIGADVIVDDLVRHVEGALAVNPEMTGILFGGDPRQNLGERVVQCFTWEQVLGERERILAGR